MDAQAATRPGSASPRPRARRRCSARWAWRGPRRPRPAPRRRREDRGARRQYPQPVVPPGQGNEARGDADVRQRALLPGQPNVPSDLQQIPNLLNFFTSNGSFLSNNDWPLIAHTADDILTTFTGLYGDRQGCRSQQLPGLQHRRAGRQLQHHHPGGSFAYWTNPVFDTKTRKRRP